MTKAFIFKDPRSLAGLAVLLFSGIVGFEAILLGSLPELLLALFLAVLGWHLRRSGLLRLSEVETNETEQQRSPWLRFCLIAPPVLVGAYVLGYLILMNKHLPTDPHGVRGRFESSFRWAGLEARPRKLRQDDSWPFPNVTMWNLIYCPMDRIFFAVHPRPAEEIEGLRARGWSW